MQGIINIFQFHIYDFIENEKQAPSSSLQDACIQIKFIFLY